MIPFHQQEALQRLDLLLQELGDPDSKLNELLSNRDVFNRLSGAVPTHTPFTDMYVEDKEHLIFLTNTVIQNTDRIEDLLRVFEGLMVNLDYTALMAIRTQNDIVKTEISHLRDKYNLY